MEKIRSTFNFFRKNIRYLFAVTSMVIIFQISRSFPAQVITSDSCADGNCQAMLDKPVLTPKTPVFYINDIFKSDSSGYYRLTFLSRANKETGLAVKITNSSDEDREIKILNLEKTDKNIPQEILFSAGSNYSDILFEKTDTNDGADVNIGSVQLSRLEINSDKEFANLKPTIRGGIDADIPDQFQKDNSHVFNQLKDPDIIFGQIFKPQADYIVSVTLDMDIVKQDNNGGKKYKFELREADFSGGVSDITSKVLSSVSFTAENVERYRQDDGKFKFPIFAKLDPEKYYFIGINNNNVSVDKFNYVRLKGAQDRGKYADGSVAVRTKGKTYSAVGSLYFVTHQLKFKEYQGNKILGGEIIEDIGKPKGFYTYRPMGSIYDLADLEEYSSDVGYNDDERVLAGTFEAGTDSLMIYKLGTIFPANKIKITGKQVSIEWSKCSVLYSYDKIRWNEIPDSVADDSSDPENGLQHFDYSWNIVPARNEIYIKIIPKDPQEKEKYGIKDLKIEAEISMR